MKKVCFFTVAVLLSAAVWGTMQIYAIAKNIENNATAYFTNAENSYASAEFNEKTQNEAKNAAKTILGSNIKLKTANASFNGKIIVCYAKNIYMELDKESLRPVLYFYACEARSGKYSEEECRRIAVQFILKNAPANIHVNNAEIKQTSVAHNTVSYMVDIGGRNAEVSVRTDTGSIVYYNGQAFF